MIGFYDGTLEMGILSSHFCDEARSDLFNFFEVFLSFGALPLKEGALLYIDRFCQLFFPGKILGGP